MHSSRDTLHTHLIIQLVDGAQHCRLEAWEIPAHTQQQKEEPSQFNSTTTVRWRQHRHNITIAEIYTAQYTHRMNSSLVPQAGFCRFNCSSIDSEQQANVSVHTEKCDQLQGLVPRGMAPEAPSPPCWGSGLPSCALMAAAVLASVFDRFEPLRSRLEVGNTTAAWSPNSLLKPI